MCVCSMAALDPYVVAYERSTVTTDAKLKKHFELNFEDNNMHLDNHLQLYT